MDVRNSKETGENGWRHGTFARVMSGLVRCEKREWKAWDQEQKREKETVHSSVAVADDAAAGLLLTSVRPSLNPPRGTPSPRKLLL